MEPDKIINFSEEKKKIDKRKKHEKNNSKIENIKGLINKYKYRLIIGGGMLYGCFTLFFYVNYQLHPENWIMVDERKDIKKCNEFRQIYRHEYGARDIKNVSNKLILSLLGEEIDYSEIFHYYINNEGKATFDATANVYLNNDFLNPSANGNKQPTYRTVEVNTGYQAIIQDTDIFYRVDNKTISDNWFELYRIILETNYDEYVIDNYFEGFFTNPPDCHGVNICFYKGNKCEKITLLIRKNGEREEEFHNFIENVAKKKWKIDDEQGPLGYLLKYCLNYPNKSYTIPEKIGEPTIGICDILIFSLVNCYSFDNKEIITCSNSLVKMMQTVQMIIFYFVVIPLITGSIVSYIQDKIKSK